MQSLIKSPDGLSGASLGTPVSTRFVIVPIDITNCAGGYSISSATIGGVAATVNYIETRGWFGDDGCVIFISANVASGSTGDIVVNGNAGTFGTTYFGVYTINQSLLLSTTPSVGSDGTGGGTSESPSVSATSTGFVIGTYTFTNGSSGKNPAVSGGFTDDDVDDQRGFFSLGSLPTTGTVSATINWTGSFSGQGVLTAWR
jgi:hypothetical protein